MNQAGARGRDGPLLLLQELPERRHLGIAQVVLPQHPHVPDRLVREPQQHGLPPSMAEYVLVEANPGAVPEVLRPLLGTPVRVAVDAVELVVVAAGVRVHPQREKVFDPQCVDPLDLVPIVQLSP